MEIRKDIMPLAQELKAKGPSRAGKSTAPPEPRDSFKYSEKDLTPDGRLPIIIESKDKASLQKSHDVILDVGGGRITGRLPIIGGSTAEVDPAALPALLKELPPDTHIFVDGRITIPPPIVDYPGDIVKSEPSTKLNTAMPAMGVDKVWEKGYKGEGITIAVIDTGVYPHKDFTDAQGKSRIIGFKDFVNNKTQPYDDQGHGTHVSGIAAGNGAVSGGKYTGAAPEASIVGVKVLNKDGSGTFSDVIKGIQWAVQNKEKYGIRVINMSLGGPVESTYKEDPVTQAIEKAVEAGIVCAIAGGNEGPYAETIGSPGNDPMAFTIGALDDKGTVKRDDDGLARFSSRGPTPIDGLTKPDALFPGVNITAPLSPGSSLDDPSIPHVGKDYITISGTSMATPGMAGLIADLIQANPKLTPDDVKKILMGTAIKLPKLDENAQGAGAIDAPEALQKALDQPAKKKRKV
jgi:serine protease AprX